MQAGVHIYIGSIRHTAVGQSVSDIDLLLKRQCVHVVCVCVCVCVCVQV